jgi:mRNA-degrading endonuclease HigB of HigAB toxin-antitoxin module
MIVLPARAQIANQAEYSESVLNALDAFYTIASMVDWLSLQAVKQNFPMAEILKDGRVIFDIDNKYHLVVKLNLHFQVVRVQFFEPYGKLMQILNDTSYLKKN